MFNKNLNKDLNIKLRQREAARISLHTLVQQVHSTFWKLFELKQDAPEWEYLPNKILALFKLNKFEGRKTFSRIIYRQTTQSIYRTSQGKAVNDWLLKLSDRIPDSMTQRVVSRSTIIRGNLDMVSHLTSIRTKIPVDLAVQSTITEAHIRCLKGVISHLGMHDIGADFRYNKNLIHIASINSELADALEEHMLKKARRYKNFYNLVGYIENYPMADKRRFFVEIFKHKKHYNAKIAIDRLKKHPELHKYFNLT